jgi:hypothetical protein
MHFTRIKQHSLHCVSTWTMQEAKIGGWDGLEADSFQMFEIKAKPLPFPWCPWHNSKRQDVPSERISCLIICSRRSAGLTSRFQTWEQDVGGRYHHHRTTLVRYVRKFVGGAIEIKQILTFNFQNAHCCCLIRDTSLGEKQFDGALGL